MEFEETQAIENTSQFASLKRIKIPVFFFQ